MTNVVSNHTIYVKFAINAYDNDSRQTKITPNNPTAVHGSNVALSITPNVGYHIDSVFVDGWHVGTVADYQFNNLTSNRTVSAKFAVSTIQLQLVMARMEIFSRVLIHLSTAAIALLNKSEYRLPC